MSFFQEVRDRSLDSATPVPALPDYLPNVCILFGIFPFSTSVKNRKTFSVVDLHRLLPPGPASEPMSPLHGTQGRPDNFARQIPHFGFVGRWAWTGNGKEGIWINSLPPFSAGMTLANLFGLVGFLLLNFVYLYAVITEACLLKNSKKSPVSNICP